MQCTMIHCNICKICDKWMWKCVLNGSVWLHRCPCWAGVWVQDKKCAFEGWRSSLPQIHFSFQTAATNNKQTARFVVKILVSGDFCLTFHSFLYFISWSSNLCSDWIQRTLLQRGNICILYSRWTLSYMLPCEPLRERPMVTPLWI